jgi:hypothetical protein
MPSTTTEADGNTTTMTSNTKNIQTQGGTEFKNNIQSHLPKLISTPPPPNNATPVSENTTIKNNAIYNNGSRWKYYHDNEQHQKYSNPRRNII